MFIRINAKTFNTAFVHSIYAKDDGANFQIIVMSSLLNEKIVDIFNFETIEERELRHAKSVGAS